MVWTFVLKEIVKTIWKICFFFILSVFKRPLGELTISRFLFHGFDEILIPYSRCSEFDKTDLKSFPTRVCLLDFPISELQRFREVRSF